VEGWPQHWPCPNRGQETVLLWWWYLTAKVTTVSATWRAAQNKWANNIKEVIVFMSQLKNPSERKISRDIGFCYNSLFLHATSLKKIEGSVVE
jgi:hypothetical protein